MLWYIGMFYVCTLDLSGAIPRTVNVALEKYTSQNETAAEGDPQYLVDGQTYNEVGQSVLINSSFSFWWHVDLQNSYIIGSVMIHKDGEVYINGTVTVYVMDAFSGESDLTPDTAVQGLETSPTLHTYLLECSPTPKGRHLVLTFEQVSVTIFEVEVYPIEDQINVDINLALGQPVTLSSLYLEDGRLDLAVDGNTNGVFFHESSCIHTKMVSEGASEFSWWEVDLGNMYTIAEVVIYNRATHAKRLNGAMVAISEAYVNMSTTDPSQLGHCRDEPVSGIGTLGKRYVVTCDFPTNGRYVLIYHTEDKYLQLCEVQVIQAKSSTTNVALFKAAYQSSVDGDGSADKAVDGVASPSSPPTKTVGGTDHWWVVDLMVTYRLRSVVLHKYNDGSSYFVRIPEHHLPGGIYYNSHDLTGCQQACRGSPGCVGVDLANNGNCYLHYQATGCSTLLEENNVDHYKRVPSSCPYILEGLTITAGEVFDRESYSATGFRRCAQVHNLEAGKHRYEILCSPSAKGRFVALTLKFGSLSLSEVEVYPLEGEKFQTSNVARGKEVFQSSDGGGVASKAIDGNNNGFFGDLACSQTKPEALSWWGVDLGSLQLVTSVVIFTRADCCAEELTGALIVVSSTKPDPITAASLAVLTACDPSPLVVTEDGSRVQVHCKSPVKGQYVWVYLTTGLAITICEVEVLTAVTYYYLPMDTVNGDQLAGDVPVTIVGAVPLVEDAIRGKAAHVSPGGYLKLDNYRRECFGNPEICPIGFTFAFWIKPFIDNSKNTEYYLYHGGNSDQSFGVIFFRRMSDDLSFLKVKTRTHIWTAKIYLHSSIWHHIALTWKLSSGLLVYLNGTAAYNSSTKSVRIVQISDVPSVKYNVGRSKDGARSTAGNFYIDELHFWSESKDSAFIRVFVQQYHISNLDTATNSTRPYTTSNDPSAQLTSEEYENNLLDPTTHCFQSALMTNPWWLVDLGQTHLVDYVTLVFPPTYPTRLHHLYITISRLRESNSENYPYNQAICTYFAGSLDISQRYIAPCMSSVPAQFVDIFLLGETTLTLCEVEIFKRPDNLAFLRPTRQSCTDFYNSDSSSWRLHSGAAVDGTLSMVQRTRAETKLEDQPWWAVDLQVVTRVTAVIVYRRRADHDIEVHVMEGALYSASFPNQLSSPSCGTFNGGLVSAGAEVRQYVLCPQSAIGNLVVLRSTNNSDWLVLMEVEVYKERK